MSLQTKTKSDELIPPILQSVNSMRYDVYDDIPDVDATLKALSNSTQLLAKNFSEAISSTITSASQLNDFNLMQLQNLQIKTNELHNEVDSATTQATMFLLKCIQLERQLSKITEFEKQLEDVQSMLPAIEKLVRDLPKK